MLGKSYVIRQDLQCGLLQIHCSVVSEMGMFRDDDTS